MKKRARWEHILPLHDNVGDELNKALAALEEANPELFGILTLNKHRRNMATLVSSLM